MGRKMTLQEAAAFLRCKPKTLYNMTSSRRIPYSKPMGRLLFDENDLEAWVKKSAVKVHDPEAVRKKLDGEKP